MDILNVSFGIFAFLPQGWLFMIFVILFECILLSRFLESKWYDKAVYWTVIFSNIISGIAGILISLELNGGWWLVVWFPWVSRYEVGSDAILGLCIYYLCAFVVTLLIEAAFNYLTLKKYYKGSAIVKNTFRVNACSYAVGSLVLYLYSFS